jgi:hypothetical protein
MDAAGEIVEGFDEGAAGGEGGLGEGSQLGSGGYEGGVVDELGGFEGGGVWAFDEEFAGLLPAEGGEDADARGFDFDDAGGGDGETVVRFEDGKRGDFVAEPVLAGTPESGFGLDLDLTFLDVLAAKFARREAKFVDALGNGLLVDMPGDVFGEIDHGA